MPERNTMSERNTVFRSLHDLGVAAWFGGSLMGVVALNGAASDDADPAEGARIAAAGWSRWAPVNAAAVGVHAVGGVGLLLANRDRVRSQHGVGPNTVIKTALTVAAAATTVYSGILGAKIAQAGHPATEAATTASADTPTEVEAEVEVTGAQRQLRVLQWVTPLLTGIIIILGSHQGEQQRPTQILRGLPTNASAQALAQSALRRLPNSGPRRRGPRR